MVARVIDQPSSLPGASAQIIDTQHLFRMTLGELSLQREVLALFDRQADCCRVSGAGRRWWPRRRPTP
jgi:hypothetical protein